MTAKRRFLDRVALRVWMIVLTALAGFSLIQALASAPPRHALSMETPEWPRSYRLHVEFSDKTGGVVRWGKEWSLPLRGAIAQDIAVEHPAEGPAILRVWSDGALVRGPEEIAALSTGGGVDFPSAGISFGKDVTARVQFAAQGPGTLFAVCSPYGNWEPGSKALFIRDGHLVYDIGWLGALSGGPRVDDGKPHVAILSVISGRTRIWLDGRKISDRADFSKPDPAGQILKVGRATPDFAGSLSRGRVESLRLWRRGFSESEIGALLDPAGPTVGTADFVHQPGDASDRPVIEPAKGVAVRHAWVQPLESADHAAVVAGWNDRTLAEGKAIYDALCVACHGTREAPGSLPTALRFAEGVFKNGSDPDSMFHTLTRGYGQMVPQNQYTTAQKYSVIQYIRETFLRPHNPSQFVAVTPAVLAALPKGLTRAPVEVEDRTPAPYLRMNFGPALFWTFQVAPGNIAQKGIAIRLDEGPGGVSKGRAWMVYDEDTLRVAAATTGEFVDWKGIAFDGSHGTHTGLIGQRHFVNPVAPGVASPEGDWTDHRLLGKDGRRYGPLPRDWARYDGLYLHGNQVVIAATIGGTPVLESPGWLDYGTTPVFTRTLNLGKSGKPIQLRVAPETVSVALSGDGVLRKIAGFWVAELPPLAKTRIYISRADPASLAALMPTFRGSMDLEPLTHGGPKRWDEEIETRSQPGKTDGPFIADDFPLPVESPWQSWMRPGGFDFTPDGRAAMVGTWNGDVWRVEGLMDPAPATLRWRRIVSGLFQPLGVKYRGQDLFITCRDQIARLQDFNGDGEIDFIGNFNNDHQVTEHFHEFAMGLQTDGDGNLYYAKSGRHALDSVVPHHGTLLRVRADGRQTDILATGFRAANGVCLNPDGSFFVTDQEGFWTPKNRINRVKLGGFYGNMFGYTSVTNTADSAMEPPMVWITNQKDRSPAELVWVPKGAWGSLGGSLLNLSYGTGRVFIVPHSQRNAPSQGAVCELPMPAFATGIMRGRFGSDGALYTCGMFAWAGNATGPGGFHRIRRANTPAYLPVAIEPSKGTLSVRLSDPLDPEAIRPEAFALKVWSLKRTAGYGSDHHGEHALTIRAARLEADRRTLILDVPDLAPTHCYELKLRLAVPGGTTVERVLHGTVNHLTGS